MVSCPKCNTELGQGVTVCFVCGADVNETEATWVIVGGIEDKISADFAKETLQSYDIRAVVFSRSGFFGTVGLPLNPIYSTGSALFEVSVMSDDVEEAIDLLKMTLGDKFIPAEK